MKRRILLILAIVFLLTALGTGSYYFYNNYQANKEKFSLIRVAESTPAINKLPHYLAMEESLYKNQLVKLEQIDAESDWEALTLLEEGKADIALVEISSLIYKRTSTLREGTGLTLFALLDQGTSYHLMSRENKSIDDMQALKNKAIITGPPNSIETVFLESNLRDAGINPYESVTMITNIPEEIKFGALSAGTGHYLLTNENNLIPAISNGFYNVKTVKTDFPIYVCVASPEFIKQQPEALQRFTNSIYMALVWLKYHTPEESAETMEESISSMDEDLFPVILKQYYNCGGLPENPVPETENIDVLIDMFKRSREIPMPIKADEITNLEFANIAVKTINYIPEDKKPKKTGLDRLKFWED